MDAPRPKGILSDISVCQAAGSSHISGLNLLLVGENSWLTDFECFPDDTQGHSLVVLRTIEGIGEISLEFADRESTFQLGPDSLILLDDVFLTRYRVIQEPWRTHWYDFVADMPETLPLHQLWEIPPDCEEHPTFLSIRSEITSRDSLKRQTACARFGLLLRKWLARANSADCSDEQFACTERAVRVMHENLYQPVGIDRIAQDAGVNPTMLRRAFASRMGLSPKKFYNRLRMNEAAKLLRTGSSVAETAKKLCFSDAFHFSRAFKRYFQVAPKTKKPRRVN